MAAENEKVIECDRWFCVSQSVFEQGEGFRKPKGGELKSERTVYFLSEFHLNNKAAIKEAE